MIIGFQENDIQTWKSSLLDYELNKKSKFTSAKDQSHSIRQIFKSKPSSTTNAVIQTYVSSDLDTKSKKQAAAKQQSLHQKYLGTVQKYQKPYDIITLHPLSLSMIELEPIIPNKNRAPIRNLHNIINGSPIPEQHLKNRVIALPPHYAKKQIKNGRDFNIINNEYKSRNQQRTTVEQESKNMKILQNYNKKRIYDKIYNRFYNPEEEQQYWHQKIEKDQQYARQNFDLKLPPSYQVRERFIQDGSKPFPQGLIKFKEKLQNSKRHHQLKYLKEDEYKQRNIEAEGKDQRKAMNRIYRTNDRKQNKSSINTTNTYKKDNVKIKGIGFRSD